eukprot:CAMPEP_0114176832 /NCGR_PEP_ID=MMETSP0043_2-20121206/37700_1 /TAXON_ID=464988 /ORGANISM="Hemiselmis andersenii, Strain CCMP644" /LENGTH=97 /DNA_ID=CAMNT_0001275163 /DNA_START=223 /DNA_END=512 /DNA_ORIENTATION=+
MCHRVYSASAQIATAPRASGSLVPTAPSSAGCTGVRQRQAPSVHRTALGDKHKRGRGPKSDATRGHGGLPEAGLLWAAGGREAHSLQNAQATALHRP